MSGPNDDTQAGEVTEQAARWFVRLQDEASTGDDWLAFEAWLAETSAHQVAYESVERAWVDVEAAGPLLADVHDSQAVAAVPHPVPDRGASAFPSPPPRRRLAAMTPSRAAGRGSGMNRRAWALGAGALAASLAVAVIGLDQWPGKTPGETFITPAGQTRRVTLGDGSHVWLNAGTRIDVRLERKARRVELADGEAVFDVIHDAKRPFLISTGQREVRVVGTEFNLRQRNGDFDLTVRRGVVEVRPAGQPTATPTRVSAGHRFTALRGASSVLAESAPDAAFAWTQGQLVYDDATLSTVAADLSRSLGTPVRVADSATGQLRFTGVLALDDQAAVLRRLEGFAPVRVEAAGSGYMIHRR